MACQLFLVPSHYLNQCCVLLTEHPDIMFNEIRVNIYICIFSLTKLHLKIYAKYQPFCRGLNDLKAGNYGKETVRTQSYSNAYHTNKIGHLEFKAFWQVASWQIKIHIPISKCFLLTKL